MAGAVRIAVAAALIAALACLPIVLDQCSASCGAHQNDAAAAPPCHHVHGASARIGHAPAACDHDHSASIGALQSALSVPQHSIETVALAAARILPANGRAWTAVSMHAPPGPTGSIHASSLPLRV
jgi:hypothetical protein